MNHSARWTEAEPPESTDRLEGRVLEAKGTNAAGGRVFGMQVIAYGDSRNGRRYPQAVLSKAATLYEGTKVYDHHRSESELTSSTIAGLVGSLRNVSIGAQGIEAELHLLPSANHTAEALDASLDAQAAGRPPLVGMSHDVYANYRPVVEGGRRLQEATLISKVNSADVVADPAAGGRVTRMVAGGSGDANPEEGPMKTLKEVLALLRAATDKASYDALTEEHKAVMETAGLSAEDFPYVEPTTTTAPVSAPPVVTTVAEPKEPVLAGVGAQESLYARDTLAGAHLVGMAVKAAKLPERAVEAVSPLLPEKFTESQLVKFINDIGPRLAASGLVPTAPVVGVTKDEMDRKAEAVERMLISDPSDVNFGKGYTSLHRAYIDVTGTDMRQFATPGSPDFARQVWRESIGATSRPFDAGRVTESVNTGTWTDMFGDALHKRMIAEYKQLGLDDWRKIVSSIVTVNDFRDQKPMRMGGYGVLPIVPEEAPYQALTTPGDEQVPWNLDKRGGTESWSWESVKNDDLRAISRIPAKLGRAAAQTLYRFVFDFLRTNPTMPYDSTALFHTNHANTANPAVLSEATYEAGWLAMAAQTAYGDSNEFLAPDPAFLIVPSALWPTAWRLTNSGVSVTSNANATIPNFVQGISPIRVPYFTDANDWFLVADPRMTPTIEVGFLDGRQDPELFMQADPTQGSLFDADVIKIKIRHVYGGTPLDHRGFYRGANA